MTFKVNISSRMLLRCAVVAMLHYCVTSENTTRATITTTGLHIRPDLERVEIETKLGTLVGVGKELRQNDKYVGDIINFFDVTYASPPTGDLRFRKPVPAGNWTGVKDARKMTSLCVQSVTVPFTGSTLGEQETEDCLNMDIYVPHEVTAGSNKAVLIWIHSSGFIFGGKHHVNADWMALIGDVIVVVPNYRLGIFGFLATGDKESPGNFGIWDIQLATKWVKDNIESFGGDPKRITVGAGPGSEGILSILSTYPQNLGLFQRAVAMGLSPTQKWPIVRDPFLLTLTFVKMAGCGNYSRGTFDSRLAMECVRNLSTETIKETTSDILKSTSLLVDPTKLFLNSVLGPVIDGDILKTELSSSNTVSEQYTMFRSLDYLSGNVDEEGSVITQILTPHIINKYNISIKSGIPEAFLCDELAPAISKAFYRSRVDVTSAICNRYTVIARSSVKFSLQSQAIVNGFGDYMYVGPVVEALRLHSRSNEVTSTYQYLLTKSTPGVAGLKWLKGTRHGMDMHYFLDVLPNDWSYTQEDLDFAKTLVTYITNFVKTGNPNDEMSEVGKWKPFLSPTNEHYLVLKPIVTTRKNLYRDRMTFWLSTIPTLMKRPISPSIGRTTPPIGRTAPSSGQTAPPVVQTAPSVGHTTTQQLQGNVSSTTRSYLSTSQQTAKLLKNEDIKVNNKGHGFTTTVQTGTFGKVVRKPTGLHTQRRRSKTNKRTNNSGTLVKTTPTIFVVNILMVIISFLSI